MSSICLTIITSVCIILRTSSIIYLYPHMSSYICGNYLSLCICDAIIICLSLVLFPRSLCIRDSLLSSACIYMQYFLWLVQLFPSDTLLRTSNSACYSFVYMTKYYLCSIFTYACNLLVFTKQSITPVPICILLCMHYFLYTGIYKPVLLL